MKSFLLKCFVFAIASAISSVSWAVEDIVVMALFTEKAVLTIDGKRRVLSVGQISKEGVLLVSANSEEAVLEVDGKREVYPLGMHISTGYKKSKTTEVNLWADQLGMFNAAGSINGQLVNFLVDTGATTIAMNAYQAKRLGIDYLYLGQKVGVSTASGTEVGYHVKLNRVKVGEIELRDISAIVMDSPYPVEVLLGMSFLGQLEMDRRGKMMVLRKKN